MPHAASSPLSTSRVYAPEYPAPFRTRTIFLLAGVGVVDVVFRICLARAVAGGIVLLIPAMIRYAIFGAL
ncbi:hypothetical protein ITJ57_17155 [Plantibacter sp. VKM Ac-2880]|uniref:hypothetical protein n=1 Tax=Plantibacter sp. VKM Ac-2880 TaxID=2783827 RepID=UPI00188E9E97|nr:hypothetical protein [Plantibacter sp. VKM Ac-2880]MBF4570497.1 hypothetical protein [Plantibacter sp. VKM Ac-2880]